MPVLYGLDRLDVLYGSLEPLGSVELTVSKFRRMAFLAAADFFDQVPASSQLIGLGQQRICAKTGRKQRESAERHTRR
jgi:hypothetical protein